MTGVEVAVGFLIAWFLRKAGRVGTRVDGLTDEVIDATMDRVHDAVVAKLGLDPALERMEIEAAETGEIGTRTQARVRMSLEEAAEQDPAFAAELDKLTQNQSMTGPHGIVVNNGVHAKDHGIAIGGITGGTQNFPGQTPADPPGPART